MQSIHYLSQTVCYTALTIIEIAKFAGYTVSVIAQLAISLVSNAFRALYQPTNSSLSTRHVQHDSEDTPKRSLAVLPKNIIEHLIPDTEYTRESLATIKVEPHCLVDLTLDNAKNLRLDNVGNFELLHDTDRGRHILAQCISLADSGAKLLLTDVSDDSVINERLYLPTLQNFITPSEEAILGSGGEAQVYSLDDDRVIKMYTFQHTSKDKMDHKNRQKFASRLKLMIHCPCYAKTTRFGLLSDSSLVIEQERLKPVQEKEFTPEDFSSLSQLIINVQTMNKNGVFHQDIKPDNLMVNSKGGFELIDSGEGLYGTLGFRFSTMQDPKGIAKTLYILHKKQALIDQIKSSFKQFTQYAIDLDMTVNPVEDKKYVVLFCIFEFRENSKNPAVFEKHEGDVTYLTQPFEKAIRNNSVEGLTDRLVVSDMDTILYAAAISQHMIDTLKTVKNLDALSAEQVISQYRNLMESGSFTKPLQLRIDRANDGDMDALCCLKMYVASLLLLKNYPIDGRTRDLYQCDDLSKHLSDVFLTEGDCTESVDRLLEWLDEHKEEQKKDVTPEEPV